MRRTAPGVSLVLVILASVLLFAQSTPFTVLSYGPTGEINQLQDANEVRVIFSEPMVALGRIPSNPTPPWIHISPAIRGTYRWSGTTILIFTPDPNAAIPYATEYSVTIDAAATSVSGRQLAAPVRFSFTTPTVKMTSARWARQNDRFDAPVALVLRFNQPVRASDVVDHLGVRYEAHPWQAPQFSTAERARLTQSDPGGLQQFDNKVALARATAARRDAVALRIATTWDRRRFPPADTQVVVETTTAPPPGAWLSLTLDTQMPSPAGSARPSRTQTSRVELP